MQWFLDSWKELFGGGALAVFLGWLGKRVVHLDKQKAERTDLDELVAGFRAEMKELTQTVVTQRREDTDKFFAELRGAIDAQSKTNLKVAEAIGELRGAIQGLSTK